MSQLTLQTILFDLDDTLVHCNKYFDAVLEQFVDQLQTWFGARQLHVETIKQKQLEIDTAGVTRHGFTLEHFPRSLVETYAYFSDLYGRLRSHKEEDWLMKLGSSVYDQEVEPYPYMKETLERLHAAGHRLYLYTGGVAAVQEKKVKSLHLDAFFGDRIFIRQHKTSATLEAILHEHRFDRANTWMIGNSLRTDIMPSLETGINCVYIPAANEWQFNIVEVTLKPKGAFLTLKSLSEVPEAIDRYIEQRKKEAGRNR